MNPRPYRELCLIFVALILGSLAATSGELAGGPQDEKPLEYRWQSSAAGLPPESWPPQRWPIERQHH